MTGLSPFQLLEINLISAQDIAKVSRSMRTYATAWVHPERKLTTRVDTQGGTNPTWNDKFVFRVDSQFLKSDTSAIMIEIYALHWFKDIHVGTVRVLVGNLIPPQTRCHNQNHIGMRFVALQVRRPSGRPQGILNVGVTVLDSTMRSMPLYTQLSASAVGYQKLMGQYELHNHKPSGASTNHDSAMTLFRRTKSDKSSILQIKGGTILEENNDDFVFSKPNNSIINGSNLSSVVGKKGKVIYDKPLSIIDGPEATSNLSLAVKLKAQEGKAESVVSYTTSKKRDGIKKSNKKITSNASRSDIGVNQQLLRKGDFNIRSSKKAESEVGGMQDENNYKNETKTKHNWLQPTDNKKQSQDEKNNKYNHRGYPITKDFAAGSIWSESEVGPSPSEVAAAIAEDNKYRQFDDGRSSMLDDKWTIDESEGVKTKLERWRTEMPPLYDYSHTTDSSSTIFYGRKYSRRHTEGGGKFSCFSNICGLECSIVCGKGGNSSTKRTNKGTTSKNAARAPSLDSVSTYF
ncbi:hypothetical protein RND81_12G051800 [Saponaria officinalis]|uniref:C2 domain-containing protein n=1 Tax=Saponaria officinalis TaxID=3572 RepID=A0AAW1H6S9_SAPOF